jgi:CYTH domain-containing protein
MEIERKFLVNHDLWDKIEKPSPKHIIQAYLSKSEQNTIRVRTKGDKGFLTIKGPTKGISREEFEYEIPLSDATQLIENFAEKVISKKRYEITIGNHLWEVDVFMDKLEGLIIAEIELESEDEIFVKPEWVTEDVSHDPQYYNSSLVDRC